MNSIPHELIVYLNDMRETIEAQGAKIHELDKRIKELEGQTKVQKKFDESSFSLHESLQFDVKHDCIKLVRTESGSTAFALSKVPIQKFTIIYTGDNKPQYLYIGVIDAKYETAEMNCAYLFNSSGKGRIPGEQWQDYDAPMYDILNQGERFDCEIVAGGLNVMVDFGRNCTLFPKIPQHYKIMIGMFGEGEIELKNLE